MPANSLVFTSAFAAVFIGGAARPGPRVGRATTVTWAATTAGKLHALPAGHHLKQLVGWGSHGGVPGDT